MSAQVEQWMRDAATQMVRERINEEHLVAIIGQHAPDIAALKARVAELEAALKEIMAKTADGVCERFGKCAHAERAAWIIAGNALKAPQK